MLNFSSVKALVIGDVILDHYVLGKVERISPEAPVPVVHVSEERFVLGGSANVGHNLAKLGTDITLLGAVGKDESFRVLKNLCAEISIKFNYIESASPTIRKTRIIGNQQQIVRIDWEEKFSQHRKAVNHVAKEFEENDYNVIILSDYCKGLASDSVCKKVISLSNEKNIPLIIDPKGTNWSRYWSGWMVTPNLNELAAVAGERLPNTDEAVAEAGTKVRKKHKIKNLLVTRSEKGISLINDDGVFHFNPTEKIEVYDVSGAGDTVVAVMAAAVASGLPLNKAVELCNLAGGFVVRKFGTYAISIDELRGVAEGKI
jgi:D-beta-D-heptose 7-phosphate kinase/D-beta-D-heptose 1-phosphate adenosyltransferase